jgi:subfamily B ATP-binding cassette protein MsbA
MDQGRIVERGSHAQLLEMNGYYARLHARQFKDGDDSVPPHSVEVC